MRRTRGPLNFHPIITCACQIGEGSFGQVFVCISKRRNLRAAVKVVSHKHMSKSDRRHLEDEIEVMTKLSHPNITKLYDVYWTESQVFIVQELCSGE